MCLFCKKVGEKKNQSDQMFSSDCERLKIVHIFFTAERHKPGRERELLVQKFSFSCKIYIISSLALSAFLYIHFMLFISYDIEKRSAMQLCTSSRVFIEKDLWW